MNLRNEFDHLYEFNPFTPVGIMHPTDFQKILLVILIVVIASYIVVHYKPVFRFYWNLVTFTTTSQCMSQCPVECQQGRLCATINYDRIPYWDTKSQGL